MPALRVVYELLRVSYAGESVGDDWTFYIHTGAGLVSFDDELRRGESLPRGDQPLVIGVRERDAAANEFEFERELWWASATEHDPAVADHGAGLFMPVSIPLAAGVEVYRTLQVDVAEAGPRAAHAQVARLHFDIRARVEAVDDAPAPALDVTALIPDAAIPRPSQVAGALPLRFEAEVEGLTADEQDALIPVVAERRVLVGRDYSSEANDQAGERVTEALAYFLTLHSGGFLPGWFEPCAALYEIRNIDDLLFWGGQNSSMGRRNQLALVDAFAEAAPPLRGVPIEFEARPSLLLELLGHANTSDLGPGATAIAELIAAIVTQHPERAPVERQVFVRTAMIDEHAGEWTRALFIDPTPFAGPDEVLWMVAWTDAWTG